MRHSTGAAALWGALLLAACSSEAPTPSAPDAAHEQALAAAASDPALTWGPCPDLFPGECAITVLHGDPASPNADVFLRVGPGYGLVPHWHSSAERMILVTGALQVAYEGQEPVTLQAGDYAYGPARRVHSGTCLSDTPCTLFIAFEAPIDAHAADGEAN